jgi:outer membrane protein assembly factor BamB
MPNYLHAVSSDGLFHSMYVSNGEEPEPAIKFLPPNSNVAGLIVVDNVAYAVTGGGCGSAPNAVWALDIASKQVTSWQSPAAIAGSEGLAFAPDGAVLVATDAGELAALEPKTLKVRDIYKAGTPFTSSPVVLQKGEGAVAAVAAKDGRIHLIDPAKLGGTAYKSEPIAAGATALATYQDQSGGRFLLAPTANSLVALKVADQAVEPAWKRDMDSPLTPLVINGVVFGASAGKSNTPAVLYALDGSTGNPLWNSGKTITSFVHGGGLSGGGSQVYLGTNDGTFYAFGFPIEH